MMRDNSVGTVLLVLVMMIAVSMFAFAQASNQDADGCYGTASGCLVGRTEWGTGMNSNRYFLRLTNNCGGRVYVRACMLMANGEDLCGQFAISAGATYNYNSIGADSRGLVSWQWIGSAQSSKDWVCALRVSGWTDRPRYR